MSEKCNRGLDDFYFSVLLKWQTWEAGDALVFGNESSGLPKDFYERYRESLFRIPMPGEHARSINLANAVSIAAYECYRQLSR